MVNYPFNYYIICRINININDTFNVINIIYKRRQKCRGECLCLFDDNAKLLKKPKTNDVEAFFDLQ